MICTSYFSMAANTSMGVSKNVIPVSVSQWPPKWYNGAGLKDVAPTPEILRAYNNGEISEEGYTLRYQEEVLDKLDVDAFIRKLSEITGVKDPVHDPDKLIALCCFEKPGDFCHRHLLAEYLNKELGLNIREANKNELTEGKLTDREPVKEEKKAEKQLVDEIKDEMYGSVHSHAEDMFDTGNDLHEWICNFIRRGAHKVALTGHGSMFAYEDLKGILNGMKKVEDGKSELPPDYPFEVIPGVEIYFVGKEDEEKLNNDRKKKEAGKEAGDKNEAAVKENEAEEEMEEPETEEAESTVSDGKAKGRHMVLIAKNYEGYVDLCRVISDSSRNTVISKSNDDSEYLTPMVTMDNLRKNIRKGNIIATSACIGGVFGFDMGMSRHNLEEKLKKEKDAVGGDAFFKRLEENRAFVAEYQRRKNDPQCKKPTKADRTKAEKALEKNNDDSLLNAWNEQSDRYDINNDWLRLHKDKLELAKKEITKAEKLMAKISAAEEALERYDAENAGRFETIKDEYFQFEEIFGKENFYFELQNHGMAVEKEIYNRIVHLAYTVGNPHFIASNDVHIGDFKGSKTWEQSVLKRRVEKFKRFKSVENDREDDFEYGIKSDAELSAALKEIIEPYFEVETQTIHSTDEIVDSAMANIRTVLEPCHVVFPEISVKGLNHYPKFCDDEGAMLRSLVEEGVKKRFPDGLPEGYRERIEYELDVIHTMGFDGYFLIVQDYLAYGRLLGYLRNQEEIDNAPLTTKELDKYIDEHNIPRVGMGIGPGRGSATGCLCSYLIGITELDPIPYGLFFERFLNPSRQSMPDIDSDFKDDIREKVYEYIKAHYGDECVSKVATKSYTHGKGAILLMQQYMKEEYIAEEKQKKKDILAQNRWKIPSDSFKALEKSLNQEFKEKTEAKAKELLDTKGHISKKFDAFVKEKDINMTNHPERGTKALQDMLKEKRFSDDEKEMVERAIEIAGVPATLGMHACACLISGDPLRDVIPLAWNDKNQKMTTQCLYPQAEELGLLKMDLLNIKNLTVITKVMQDTGDNRISDPAEVEKILADERIFKEIYSAGKTLGIFQVESPGMTKMMKDFRPTCFEDIILLVAAYRPGPLEFIPEIIAMKRHLEDPENNPMPNRTLNIDNKELQEILAPTYGVPIYQEQVMQIFQKVAGYNLADADNVRRFMSKKKMEPLQKEKPAFINGDPERGIRGCVGAGMTKEEAELLFDKLVEFSKYAFNKSHAAAYAQVSMYTAYQKLYHPLEFYKRTLSNEIQDGGKENPITKYMGEMQSMGIGILPPMVGKSHADFEIEGRKTDKNGRETGNIRIGYGNIKGQSYKDYHGEVGMSIMSFIYKNPDVSLTDVEKFIKLGMFDRCWNTQDADQERARVCKSRSFMINWLNGTPQTPDQEASPAFGKKIKVIGELAQRKNSTKNEMNAIEKKIRMILDSGENEELLESLETDLEEITKVYDEISEDFDKKVEELTIDKEAEIGMSAKGDSEEKKMDYSRYEVEALGFPFSLINETKNLPDKIEDKPAHTFNSMKAMIDKAFLAYQPIPRLKVPAVIISSEKRTSKNNNTYYVLKLMDKNQDILTVNYFNENRPMVDKGIFTVSYRPASGGWGESYSVSFTELEEKNIKRNVDSVKLANGEVVRMKSLGDVLAEGAENNDMSKEPDDRE